jgi:hypothetical protein
MLMAIDGFTNLINSPGGVFTAGAAIAGVIWKSFDRVDGVLKDETKRDISVWLCGVRSKTHVPLPATFKKVFDHLFGDNPLSWRFFLRSMSMTGVIILFWILTNGPYETSFRDACGIGVRLRSAIVVLAVNVLPDYCSLVVAGALLKAVAVRRSSFLTISMLLLPIAVGFAVMRVDFEVSLSVR